MAGWQVADVILDPYPFGGDTSSREAFLVGTPIVTLPSEQLPGRYTQVRTKILYIYCTNHRRVHAIGWGGRVGLLP